MRGLALSAVALLGACASTPTPDQSVAAIENAVVRACPVERRQDGAHAQGFGATAGVRIEDVALVPTAADPTRAVRLRRITVAPGGVIAWHEHATIQGFAVLVSGEMVELRNTCLDPITYRAGDVAIEDANTAHSWRNEGDAPAVVLVSHFVTR